MKIMWSEADKKDFSSNARMEIEIVLEKLASIYYIGGSAALDRLKIATQKGKKS